MTLEKLAELYDRSLSDLEDWWKERAAIRQHDGGLTRDQAEQAALRDVEDELQGSQQRSVRRVR